MSAQEQISNVVNDCTALPVAVREMLVKGLPFTFGPPQERHEYQEEFVGLLRSTLEGALKSEGDALAAREDEVRKAQAELEAAVTEHKQKVTAQEEARKDFEEKGTALKEIDEAVKREESEYEQAQSEKMIIESKKCELEDESQKLASIIDGSFKMLLEGGWQDGDVEAKDIVVQAVQDHLKSGNAEAALVAAVQGAFQSRPADRGPFDKITIESLQEVFDLEKQESARKLTEIGPEYENITAEDLGVFAILEVTKDQQRDADHERNKARQHLSSCSKSAQEAFVAKEERERLLNTQLCEREIRQNRVREIKLALEAIDKLASGEQDNAMAVDEVGAEEQGRPGIVSMCVEPNLIAGH